MGQDDQIHNPVEQYMKYLMDLDKPDKPPEIINEPAQHLEIKSARHPLNKGGSRYDALKIADAIKQSVNVKKNSKENKFNRTQSLNQKRIFNIKRHPASLIIISLSGVVVYAAVFSLISFLLPGFANLVGTDLAVVGPIVGLFMLVMIALGLVLLFLIAKNYLANRLVLTDLKLIQILRTGIKDKVTMELPVNDVEDVVVRKSGIFQVIFNYGTLAIKTPEGQNDFIFKYASHPDIYAKAIQDSRLKYMASR